MTDTKAGELAEVIARVRDKATAAKASRAHLDAQTGRYSGGSVQCVLDVDDALACADAAEMGADYGKALVLSRDQFASRVAQLEAELQEAKTDAERFRWLEEKAEKARVEVLYMDARREREQLLLHVRDAEAEAKRAGERESELCGLLEELKGSAAEQQAEREQLRRELERERNERYRAQAEFERIRRAAEKETERLRQLITDRDVEQGNVIAEYRTACRERDEARAALEAARAGEQEARARLVELQAALLSQQQATDEAMRRAEEARRELASIRSELLLP